MNLFKIVFPETYIESLKHLIVKRGITNMETKELEQKITDLEKKIAKYEEFFADIDGSIRKIVCEHLYLDENSEAYYGKSAELFWDSDKLGSALIDRY